MSWTDKTAMKHIKQIRDIFSVKTFVETGTFKGMNVLAHKDNFDCIMSCEKDKGLFNISKEKTKNIKNINLYNQDSKDFLKDWSEFFSARYVIYYLDAHFYDKNRPKGRSKFVVLDELKSLKGMKNVIIIIHDFDNNLGHIIYDGISLDMNLLRKDLLKVNPKFKFYTNELSSCDIMTPEEVTDRIYRPQTFIGQNRQEESKKAGELTQNEKDMLENLKYAWSKPEKTYRGILYALPKRIKIDGLKEIK